jgi:hypothetical protein
MGEPVGDSVIAWTKRRDGWPVVLMASAWAHIVGDKEEMADHLQGVLLTVREPDYWEDDPRPGRQRFFKRGVGPDRWMRVVVELRTDSQADRVVTAFGQSNDPGAFNG